MAENKGTKKRGFDLNHYLSEANNKTFFVGAVTTVFLVLLFIFGVIPSLQAISTQLSKNKLIDETITKARTKLDNIRTMDQELELKQSAIDKLYASLPLEDLQVSIFNNIYSISSTYNINIKNIAFQEKGRNTALVRDFQVTPQVHSASLTVTAEGERNSIQQFITSIEQSRQILNITNVSIIRKSDEAILEMGTNREYDIILNIDYFFKQNNQLK